MPTPATSSPIVMSTLAGSASVDSLLGGTQWTSSSISYSFIARSFYYEASYPDKSFVQNVLSLLPAQQAAFKSALTAWANVAAISFVQSVDNNTTVGDIRIAFSSSHSWGNTAGETYLPSTDPSGGDLWLNPAALDSTIGGHAGGLFANSDFLQGSFSYFSALHELGHALGLKHPFAASPLNPTIAPSGWDSRVFTLMSYTTIPGHPEYLGFTFDPTTPMLLDVAAFQAMYGANYAFNAGDTTYGFNDNPGQYYFQTIWDGGGNNTISYSGNTSSTIDLRPGYGSAIGNRVYAYTLTGPDTYVVKNVWIAWGTRIDKAVCTGYGNNTLQANDDGDTLVAGSGNDTLIGGSGNDTFIAGAGNATISGGGGIDTVIDSGIRQSYSITKNPNGGFNVADARGAWGNGTDTLTGIDVLQFSNQTVRLDKITTASNTGDIIGAYFSMLGRAPEPSGFQYWQGQLGSTYFSMGKMIDSWLSLSVVRANGYPDGQSIDSFIASIYQNVFNKAPDDGGYWKGQSASMSRGDLTAAILATAKGVAAGTPGKAYIDNKIAGATQIVDIQYAYGKDMSIADLTTLLKEVGSVASSITTADNDTVKLLGTTYAVAGLAGATTFTDAWLT